MTPLDLYLNGWLNYVLTLPRFNHTVEAHWSPENMYSQSHTASINTLQTRSSKSYSLLNISNVYHLENKGFSLSWYLENLSEEWNRCLTECTYNRGRQYLPTGKLRHLWDRRRYFGITGGLLLVLGYINQLEMLPQDSTALNM